MQQFETYTETQRSQYDPTRTGAIRTAFARAMVRRFVELKRVVKVAVVDKDCFGMKSVTANQMYPPREHAFDYVRSADRIDAFMQWLQQQVDRGVLTLTQFQQVGRAIENAWTNVYVADSYKRGLLRARGEMIRAGMNIPSIEQSGGLEGAFNNPFHIDRVGVLYTRVFNELKGITDEMANMIAQILAQGMIDGDSPAVIGRNLVAAIDGNNAGTLGLTDKFGRFISPQRRAELLARTETIRAFHLAAVQEYRNWGVAGVKVLAEWKTAGDGRVCNECASLEGRVFTLDEIEPMLPYHPLCRCIALPL